MATFKALLLENIAANKGETTDVCCTLEELSLADLKREAGDTLVAIDYSTLNYKDALAVTNRGKIARRLPMIPGIDFAGTVLETTPESRLSVGDKVLMNGYGLSEDHWGGFSELAYVDSAKLLPLPQNMSTYEAMAYGTAGYTAALSVLALLEHQVTQSAGEILVSGASGGVGMVAIMLLKALGYSPVALSSKMEEAAFFKEIGAIRVEDARPYYEQGRALAKAKWAGAIDVVGSHTLANILSEVQYGGVVTACGLAQGMELPTTVAPFILRGITLVGIDSVQAPMIQRERAWELLSKTLDPQVMANLVEMITLEEIPAISNKMLAGEIKGRFVVKIGGAK